MTKERTGPLWSAMRAAVQLLDLNRDGQMSGQPYNANVTPVLDLVRDVIEQCAQIADRHATEARTPKDTHPALIAEEIRKLAQ